MLVSKSLRSTNAGLDSKSADVGQALPIPCRLSPAICDTGTRALMTYPFAAHEMSGSINVAQYRERKNCWRKQRLTVYAESVR
jgi:hypothetical protein